MNEQGNVIASGSVDKEVRLWDCRSNDRLPIQILRDAKDTIGSIDINATEILVGSLDGFVRIYDLRNAKMIQDPLGEAVTRVKYSVDGLCYLAACSNDTIRLVDRSDGATLNTFKGHKNRQYAGACTFNVSGSHVLGGSEDGLIHIWDFESSHQIQVLQGHTNVVSSLDYHPKSDLLISSSFDGTLRVWA